MFPHFRLMAATTLVVSLLAQETSTATVRGRLIGSAKWSPNDYVIELTNLSTHAAIGRIEVSLNGDFTVRSVPYGDYLARVTTYHGDTIAQQLITINQSIATVDLKLPERPATPSGRTVSLRELRRPPRRQAVDASAAAQRFSTSGQFDKAATALEKAVRISPEYAIAHSNLGVQYLRLGRHAEAETEIRRAIEIAGPNPRDLANLAFAQLMQERFDESAGTARSSLKLGKDATGAHFVLGLTLVLQPGTRGEGLAHLEEAAKTLDSARRALTALGR